MLILIDMLCVYMLNVDVRLFSTGSQDVTIKMTTIFFFLSRRLRRKVTLACVVIEIIKFVARMCCDV